eukprot:TRINITY_DN4626_c0_g4_i2.p1 TRINITY_DN4626_c0_g4~~TRINITY_DN4626_c0_g4_i2.p1  ORF type:complete len:109 (-),score=14.49 TRINITY_DN4626_c0_g4_i2:87-413(-)
MVQMLNFFVVTRIWVQDDFQVEFNLSLAMRSSHGYFVVYNVTDMRSFRSVEYIVHRVQCIKNGAAPIIIIAYFQVEFKMKLNGKKQDRFRKSGGQSRTRQSKSRRIAM